MEEERGLDIKQPKTKHNKDMMSVCGMDLGK